MAPAVSGVLLLLLSRVVYRTALHAKRSPAAAARCRDERLRGATASDPEQRLGRRKKKTVVTSVTARTTARRVVFAQLHPFADNNVYCRRCRFVDCCKRVASLRVPHFLRAQIGPRFVECGSQKRLSATLVWACDLCLHCATPAIACAERSPVRLFFFFFLYLGLSSRTTLIWDFFFLNPHTLKLRLMHSTCAAVA